MVVICEEGCLCRIYVDGQLEMAKSRQDASNISLPDPIVRGMKDDTGIWDPCNETMEATQGQILSQSPTYATSGR